MKKKDICQDKEISLFAYYKQGDDLYNHLAATKNPISALRDWGLHLESVAHNIIQIANLLEKEKTDVQIEADVNFINLSNLSENIIKKLSVFDCIDVRKLEEDELAE